MTANLFYVWALYFIEDMKIYRHTLVPQLRHKPIVLILDGHASHGKYDALKYLRTNNIIVLCLPPHCTHLCQPFDVVIGNLLKTKLKELILKFTLKDEFLGALYRQGILPAKDKRFLMIKALINAWNSILIPESAEKSFEITGLFPFDMSRLFESRFWYKTPDAKTNKAERNNLRLSNKNLTDPHTLLEIYNHKQQSPIEHLDLIPESDPNDFFHSLMFWRGASENVYQECECFLNLSSDVATNTGTYRNGNIIEEPNHLI
jgi:hypothetical protein